jgi:glycosyltransferase involved in cell wall biosynthesis
MTLVAGEISGSPWSFTAHAWDITDWSSAAKIAENRLLDTKIARACFARFTSRSGVSRARAQKVTALSEAKVCILYTGVPLTDLRGVRRADEQKEASDLPVVLCPAYLIPFKGHKYLLEAVALLRQRGIDLELWLAGEGELREELQRQVRALGLSDRVEFLGQLSHPDLLELYRQDKIAVVALASIALEGGYYEGLPNALIEAMGYQVPVVSTTTGGIPELLEGGAGLLVAPEDPAGLAGAIGNLIEDPRLRESQGKAGRKRVEENLAIEKIVSQLVERFKACA